MVVRNDITRDSRVRKEAQALIGAGHDVRVFALATGLCPPGVREMDGVEVQHVADSETAAEAPPKRETTEVEVQHVADTETASISVVRREVRFLAGVVRRFRAAWHRKLRILAIRVLQPLLEHHVRRLFVNAVYGPVREWGPDVIHCHDLETVPVGMELRRRTGIGLVYDSHELWRARNSSQPHNPLRFALRWYEGTVERKCLNMCDLVITVSPGIGEVLARSCPGVWEKMVIVRNVANSSVPKSPWVSVKAVDASLQVFYSGRITIGRNLERLIEAAALDDGGMTINLLGYGSAAHLEGLKSLATNKGVDLRIIPAVEPNKVPERLSEADVVFVGVDPIVESYRLSLPNKFFEALLSGQRVAAPALPEMLNYGKGIAALFWYEPQDVVSIHETLRQAANTEFDLEQVRQQRNERITWADERQTMLDGYARTFTSNANIL